jgi:hypothetical protein
VHPRSPSVDGPALEREGGRGGHSLNEALCEGIHIRSSSSCRGCDTALCRGCDTALGTSPCSGLKCTTGCWCLWRVYALQGAPVDSILAANTAGAISFHSSAARGTWDLRPSSSPVCGLVASSLGIPLVAVPLLFGCRMPVAGCGRRGEGEEGSLSQIPVDIPHPPFGLWAF